MAKTQLIIPTRDRLMSVLSYDPDTGVFRWKQKMGARAREGAIAGCTISTQGYRMIAVDRHTYRAARLAWLYVYGNPVPEYVDHRNGVRTDDRIDNLRSSTNSQNCANSGARKHNTSGFKGVSWDAEAGKWKAKISVNYKQMNLGRFTTKEEAAAAYESAAHAAFGEFARTTKE